MLTMNKAEKRTPLPPGWQPPPVWSVPREWPGERCFILCGGESLRPQRELVPRLKGRVIAVKEGILLRPDADVLFLGGESSDTIAKPLFPRFRGTYMIARGRSLPTFPPEVKRVTRTKDHAHLCELPTHVCGYDTGTSAINLAYHFGSTEIVMLGYDMCGGRWFTPEEWPHPLPVIPESHFREHLSPLPQLAEDCKRKGIRVVNCSPISRVKAFEYQPLEAFL